MLDKHSCWVKWTPNCLYLTRHWVKTTQLLGLFIFWPSTGLKIIQIFWGLPYWSNKLYYMSNSLLDNRFDAWLAVRIVFKPLKQTIKLQLHLAQQGLKNITFLFLSDKCFFLHCSWYKQTFPRPFSKRRSTFQHCHPECIHISFKVLSHKCSREELASYLSHKTQLTGTTTALRKT